MARGSTTWDNYSDSEMSFKDLDRYRKSEERKEEKKATAKTKERNTIQVSRNKAVVNQPTKMFRLFSLKPHPWRFAMADRIAKDRGIESRIVLEHYLVMNALPVYVVSALSGASEAKIKEYATAKYFGSTIIEEPKLTSVILFRLYKGSEPTDKGIEGILLDNKFVQWMNAIHKRKKLI